MLKLLSFFRRKKIVLWSKALLGALLFLLFIRGFVMEPLYLQSSSMEKSLMPGDIILVNKLSYGPRLIRTPLSLPFTHGAYFSDFIQLPYYRFFGEPAVKQNDILVFNNPLEFHLPVDQRTRFVQRCIGLPGDSLQITASGVYINRQLLKESDNMQFNYTLKIDTGFFDSLFIQKYGLNEGALISPGGEYSFSLVQHQYQQLKTLQSVQSIKRALEKAGSFDEAIFPYSSHYPWNTDNIGPLYIPKKGDTLLLDSISIPFYKEIIQNHEHNELIIKNDTCYINGKKSAQYITRQNYYFVLGDNRHNAIDSRYWGFLPEDHILGKASFILFNVSESDSTRKNHRKFTSINP